jgi:creatinine amidohydrolase/Fe(II)-dependent formamide hydrolase-like protein
MDRWTARTGRDSTPSADQRPFSLDPKSPRYNASGVYGDATLATAEKGRILLEGYTRLILSQIEELRRAAPPAKAQIYGPTVAPPPPAPHAK